jgi:Mrp family chromosome partitioning ATPase
LVVNESGLSGEGGAGGDVIPRRAPTITQARGAGAFCAPGRAAARTGDWAAARPAADPNTPVRRQTMKSIVCAANKGGVSKTTLTAALAIAAVRDLPHARVGIVLRPARTHPSGDKP